MIGRVPDAILSSPPRRKPGWWRWLAGRPRSWVIRTNCGPPGCWPRMPVVTRPAPVLRAWRTSARDGLQDPGRARRQAAQKPALAKAGVRYYLEKRDPEFEPKMAEILCVYRQVAMLPSGDAAYRSCKGPRQRRGPRHRLLRREPRDPGDRYARAGSPATSRRPPDPGAWSRGQTQR